jgi:hypothetical protein
MTRQEFDAQIRRCEVLRRGGDLNAAYDAYALLLERRVAGRLSGTVTPYAADLLVIERVADMAGLFGHFEAAEELLGGMTLLCDEAGNDYYTDYSILKRTELAFNRGDVRAAEELLGLLAPRVGDIEAVEYTPQGLERWERACAWRKADADGRTVIFAFLYLCVGQRWAALGCYGRALLTLGRGLTHAAAGAPDLARKVRPHIELALSNARLESGDLPGALAALEALGGASGQSPQSDLLTHRLELSGKLDMLQGRFGGAEENFARVLELCVERQFHRGALVAALNLSHVQIHLNQTLLARLSLEAVLGEALRIEDVATAARAEFLLAHAEARSQALADGTHATPSVARMRRGAEGPRPAPAEDASEPDPFEIPESGSFLTFFEDQLISFHHLLGAREVSAASLYLDKLEALFGETDSELIRVRLRVMRGMSSYYRGREQSGASAGEAAETYRLAERELAGACERLEELGLKQELWQALRMLNWCHVRLGRGEAEIRRAAERADALLSEMTLSLPAAERFLFLIDKWTFDEEIIGVKVEEIKRLQREVATRPRLRSLRERWALMRRIHELLHHVNRHKDALSRRATGGGDAPGTGERPPSSLWRRLWRHPLRRVTLSLLVLPNRLLIIHSGFLSVSLDTRDVTRLKIRELVQRWHLAVCRGRAFDPLAPPAQRERARHLIAAAATGSGPREGHGESLNDLGAELAEALSLPAVLGGLPRFVRALTIVPDDSLHGFPFAAVRYRGRYLVERFALSLAFESGEGRPAADTPGAKEALLVAVPQGALAAELPGGPVDIPALSGTVAELRKVRAWLRRKHGLGVCRLDGVAERATKETVLSRLPSAALFHAACHGFSDVERPEQAGLLLVPREGEVELLTLRELSSLDLPALQHVTLSSCWSADNFVLPGRWIISLPETLWRAGARSVLGSLWEVRDDVAVAFMKHFYRGLDHYPRDQALQMTQLACLKRKLLPRKPESHPINSQASEAVNWAGYNLYGDYRPLRFGGRHFAREFLGLLRRRAPGEGRNH